MHSTIRHEIQHYIQHKEGFPVGASKEREGVQAMERYLDTAESRINVLKGYLETGSQTPAVTDKINEEIERLQDDIEAINVDRDEAATYFYMAQLGEMEAANVEKRLDENNRSKGSPNTTSPIYIKRHGQKYSIITSATWQSLTALSTDLCITAPYT